MDAGRGQDRLTIVEQPPRPPTTFYPTSMDSLNQQQHQQLRAGTGYGDLCRTQGPTDALSAAYHSRYLASLPALSSTSGSSFPFLGSMFASGPTSPFRAPSAPGVSNCGTSGTTNPMRQQLFWPPTPPPDGYGRYGLNTSLFPLFGSVSPSPNDGGATAAAYMLSQGLVSRHLTPCTTTTSSHPLLDTHKDRGFFSPGFGLGSPLTPSSQMTATNPFSHHLIPPPHPLDYNKFSSFCPPPGLNSTGTKDFLAAVTDDSKSQPHHHHHHHHHHPTNCQLTVKSENSNSPSTTSISSNVAAIKHSHPQQTPSSKSSRSERKSVSSYSPKRSKDTRHNEDIKPQAKSQDEPINKHYQQSRHLQHYFPPSGMKSCSPFEIDVTCGPTIKPDILSPPIDSSSDAALPGSPYQDKKKDLLSGENRCLSCANDVLEKNDIPKVEEDEDENSVVVIVDIDEKTSRSSPKNESADDTVPNDSSMTVMTKSVDVKSVDCSDIPKNEVVPPPMPNSVFPTFDKSDSSNLVASSRADTVVNNVNSKHVTAAVIPTAPKQQHFSNYHHSRVDTVNSTLSRQSSASELETKGTCRSLGDSPKITLSALSKIKSELTESVESALPVMYHQNSSSNFCRHLSSNVNKTSCTKVKDMIKSMDSSAKQTSSPSQVAVVDGHQTTPNSVDKTFRTTSPSVTKLCPVMPEKTVQGKVQAMTVDSKKRIVGPLKAESPVYRFDSFNNDLSPKPSLANWSKATVSPYNWQQKDEDQQAINLTVCKKNLEPVSPLLSSTENVTTEIADPGDARITVSTSPKTPFTVENIMSTSNTTTTSCCVAGTGVIGVCHPNVTKGKMFAVGGSVSKFSAMTSVTSQMDVGNDGEVHLSSHSVHATKSSTFQTLNPAAAACLNRAASVTGFQNTKTQLKTERLTPHVRIKGKDSEKIMPNTGRAATLATLAPKLTKKLGFLKDGKSSHTLSTSSSVSSTSIVFPATGNSCIPVGIAIAQQRQDSSTTATVGKNHTSVASANTGISPSAAQLTSGRVPTEIQQSQEFLRDQKPQDISCPTSTVSSDSANFLVTQGPTIVSRQWESEAVTRATLPSPWLAQGPIVAPALWIGQGTTAAAAYAATSAGPAATPQLPAPIPTSVNPLEPSPISLPPGGYQLARDSVTGHLFLIPAANIVDRTAMWPSYNASAGSTLPIQQLVTQQHHTQFEQVLPQVPEQEHLQDCLALSVQQTQIGESGKDIRTIDNCCDTPGNYKTTDLHGIKTEEKDSNHVPPVPLASGQTFTFTTFPTPCDPSGFSYVLQSSTVMHLAHTAQTTSIQTESGKRSQGTSPLHPATPSPSPSLPMSSTLLMSENEEEETQDSDSDGMASGDSMQLKISQQTQSVTTAVQVDMDSRTNSEEEDEEEEVDEDDDKKSSSVNIEQVKMSDSANQTETVLSDLGKGDSESELLVEETTTDETKKAAVIPELTPCTKECLALSSETIDVKKISSESPVSEIFVTEDCEIAPSLPVESKPVMDFIDHHGLDLLVDSIEEFASRERQETEEEEQPQHTPQLDQSRLEETKHVASSEKKFIAPVPSYGALDTSCTDGLGLLCALAEQRFFEEARISDGTVDKPSTEKLATEKPATEKPTTEKLVTKKPAYDCYSFLEDEGSHNVNAKYSSPKKEASFHKNASPSPSFQQIMDAPVEDLPSSNLRACEKEMRKRLADLQRKYKEKQLQLARLMPNGDSDEEDSIVDDGKPSEVPHHFHNKRTLSLPRFKRKSMTSGKSSTRFQSHSYKAMTQRLTNNRSNLSNNFQKRKLQKIGRTSGLSKLTEFSTNHSKEASDPLPVSTESENKVKKPAKIQVDSLHTRDKSNLFNKSKIMRKNVQKDIPSKSSACHESKPPSSKVSHSKSKTSFPQKCSVVSKHENQRDSVMPITKSKPGETLKSSKLSSNTNSLHESSKHRVEVSHGRPSSESQLKRKAVKYETKQIKRIKMENSQSSCSTAPDIKTKIHGESSQIKKPKTESHQMSNRTDSKGKEKSKVPFFDEQAWFVRRSERIFLSDARSPLAQQSSSSSNTSNSNNNAVKKVNPPASNASQKVDSSIKDKKENSVKSPVKISDSKPNVSMKSEKDKEQLWKSMKNKLSSKPKSKLPGQVSKKRSTSSSSSKSSESSSSVDSDSSDDSSSHSDNLSPRAAEDNRTPVTASVEKPKKTEMETKANTDREKEVVRVNNSTSSSTQACLLEPKLEDHARVLVLDEGLFYAGHVIDIEAPDVYGIILDGKRIHRPYIFSREEILNAAVLEIKPTETTPLPEGCRVCAYWSQQYRCLYPGTVAKACSPLSDPSLLYVEFDDGDSGRIPLDDIRMLPPDFPIVSMDLNPLSLLGKRRPRIDKDSAGEQKSQNPPPQQKIEKSHVKDSPRIKRKRTSSADGKVSREHSKNGNQSPSNKKASYAPNESQTITVSKQADPSVPTSTSSDKIKSKKIKVKEEGNKKKKVRSRDSSTDAQLKSKKRKKHREEHKHHHKHKHHHHKHHHKKHKQNHSAESLDDCSEDTSKVTSLYSPSHDGEMVILTAEKTSDLTVTIKTSPSPHTTNAAAHGKHLPDPATSEKSIEREGASSSRSSDGKKNDSNVKPKVKSNKKKVACEMRPAKRKERVPSVEKSKIAAFLPVRQLWRWSGKGFRRPGGKGKGKKEFFRAIQRGKELLRVGDCAVFLSTGRPHLPYIGRIETMWESWGGKMDVRVKWFYHPEETKSSKKLTHLKGALFQSPHFDENDVQTISHKCEVLSWDDYQERRDKEKADSPFFDNNDTYYLAGTYDPITGNFSLEPGVPKAPTAAEN